MTTLLPLTELFGLDDDHVDPTIIRELLTEQFNEARVEHARKHHRRVVWIGVDSLYSNNYHQDYCPTLALSGIDRFSLPIPTAAWIGFTACTTCIELTVAQWATHHNASPALVEAVMNGTSGPLHNRDAITLLHVIGEPPHPHLRRWHRRQQRIAAA